MKQKPQQQQRQQSKKRSKHDPLRTEALVTNESEGVDDLAAEVDEINREAVRIARRVAREGDALVAGGLPVAEVTFRTAAAADARDVDALARAGAEVVWYAGGQRVGGGFAAVHLGGRRLELGAGLEELRGRG